MTSSGGERNAISRALAGGAGGGRGVMTPTGRRGRRRVVPARFFTAEAGPPEEVPEPAFWAAVERLAARGARAHLTAAAVCWRLPARTGPVVARLEREREAWR
jgi:hypothetical protein